MKQSIQLEVREVLALYEITTSLTQTPAIVDVNKGANNRLQDVANACLLAEMLVYLMSKHNRLRGLQRTKRVTIQLRYDWIWAFAQEAACVDIGPLYQIIFQNILLKLNVTL